MRMSVENLKHCPLLVNEFDKHMESYEYVYFI